MKRYTRKGDDGAAGLLGDQRVRKDALRIDEFGAVDELCSVIGLARTTLAEYKQSLSAAAKLGAWLPSPKSPFAKNIFLCFNLETPSS